jgi:hypothetical protein
MENTKTLKNDLLTVEFVKNNDDKINIYVNGSHSGYLYYDEDYQDQWVLVGDYCANAISYYNDLNLTEETILDDFTEKTIFVQGYLKSI